jgi:hypothetical protein
MALGYEYLLVFPCSCLLIYHSSLSILQEFVQGLDMSSPLSLPLFRNLNFSSLCLCLLLQNHYTNLLCLSLAHSSPKSQKANEIPLYQRYDQGPPMRRCENLGNVVAMSPLRCFFGNIERDACAFLVAWRGSKYSKRWQT